MTGSRRLPSATYRLQFHTGLRLDDARRLVSYLHRLGITDVYASPLLKARGGSTHGYDVVDPTVVDPTLGDDDALAALAAALAQHDMGLLLDIVPNHMAACYENPWWRDVLIQGPGSPYARYFDIDWHPDPAPAEGRLLLPVLRTPLHCALESGELTVVEGEDGLELHYGERCFPLRPGGERAPAGLPGGHIPSDPISPDRLGRLLAEQPYRLAYWRTGRERLNYRRFFDIADLVALRIEEPSAFDDVHRRVGRWVDQGWVTGLRVDHIDGLADPFGYLRQLRARIGEAPFLVVEKILAEDERLPEDWPVDGTTGYEFLNELNGVFVDRRGYERLMVHHDRFVGDVEPFGDLVRRIKLRLMYELFPAELRSLVRRLHRLAEDDRRGCDLPLATIERALVEVTASLAVYRTYTRGWEVSPADRRQIDDAVADAGWRNPELGADVLAFIRRAVTAAAPDELPDGGRQRWLRFVRRWQQFTGPLTAKGIEDTALYRFGPLLSLNEVGGGPERRATVAAFHRANRRRGAAQRSGLNATSTHDAVRSEDVRARIDVLSELPDLWWEHVVRWHRWHAEQRRIVDGDWVPGPEMELHLYQTLIGAWPVADDEVDAFRRRVQRYVRKAAREAKRTTGWSDPNPAAEDALAAFVDALFFSRRFLEDFRPLQQRVAFHGAINGLAQVLLKVASPGIADFYQGSERWCLRLVDPDNRATVDFQEAASQLEEVQRAEKENPSRLRRELLAHWQDGRMKLYLTTKALSARREAPRLFREGAYLPVFAHGVWRRHVCAFARREGELWALAVAPRLTVQLMPAVGRFDVGDGWKDTVLSLPPDAPHRWRNVVTGEELAAEGGRRVPLTKLLGAFPVALLIGGERTT